MKKFTGRYTTNTAKALKGSERILCQVSEDGTIYICNGFLLCTMNAPEYAATVQPLTCCEPGAWTFDKDGKHEDEAHKLDLVKLFADTVRTVTAAEPLARAPFTVQARKAPAVQADKPGEYVYCYEMQQAPTGCDFAADLSYYGKHYFLRPLRDDLPQLHGRGISYDEERNTYTVTTRAYDKLKEQYRIRYETCLD